MANLKKKPKRRKKAKAVPDTDRVTDDTGRLKLMKTSKYLKTITQGEN